MATARVSIAMNDEYLKIDVDGTAFLSRIKASDREAFVAHLNDRHIYERTLRIPHPYTLADADTFVEIVQSTEASHGHPVHFAIRDKNNRLIGALGFESIRYGHRAEIGYWLGRPYWGQGIMTNVVRAVCVYATTQWKLVRITANVFDFNTASARVLEKNGFQLEGTLRKVHLKDEQFIDAKVYALVQ